ncbi:hypothetical protein [Flavobacterium saccharophilum]|uniref:Uncharacterized protein n=1 Tax=Flavobacterium saccharophilum TaxID=29534 RepID=A0A1M7FRA3_9FLAO|nr:hypothetical protein [Flavobacterium saccharophilum]SHM06642.1 hypothetical protein SAMN05444366_2234 [Flavobacterium saccharophilum]
MRTFKDFVSFNQHIGLAAPIDNNIDVGYYDAPNMLLKSESVIVDFYRISIKINFVDKSNPNAVPINAIFF